MRMLMLVSMRVFMHVVIAVSVSVSVSVMMVMIVFVSVPIVADQRHLSRLQIRDPGQGLCRTTTRGTHQANSISLIFSSSPAMH